MSRYTAEQIDAIIARDTPFSEAYGPDWKCIRESTGFYHNYGYEVPAEIHGWEWSTTFGRWSALVTFADGWHGFTWPQPALAQG
jgi:hypothetical protein